MRRIVLLLASMALAMLVLMSISYARSGGAVAQTESGVVTYYASVDKWGSKGSADGQFNYPTSVTTDSSGNVYVTDRENSRIQKFDSEGNFLTKWGTKGTANGQFDWPSDVAVDSHGNVYVVDSFNNRIQKFDSGGSFLAKWGREGSADGQFGEPGQVSIDSSDNVYVTDFYNNRVQKFTSNGQFLGKWGGFSSNRAGEFSNPQGVATNSQGDFYVADSERIQKFSEVPLDTDVSAPVTRYSLTSGLSVTNWQNNNVTVELRTRDVNGSGGKQITYQASGAQPIPSTTVPGDNTKVTIREAGRTTLTFFSTDLAGNTEQFPKSITVKIDKINPKVVSTVPSSDAKHVSPNIVVKAYISEWVYPWGRWNSNEFKLSRVRADGSLVTVASTVTYDSETNKAKLTPSAPLKVGATYRAKVNNVLRDRASNWLDQNPTKPYYQPKYWRFTVDN